MFFFQAQNFYDLGFVTGITEKRQFWTNCESCSVLITNRDEAMFPESKVKVKSAYEPSGPLGQNLSRFL